jgi:hypothetical protein
MWIVKTIIAYVKNEGSNLIAIATTLKSIIKCKVLGLDESFQTCFGHFFKKKCEYVITNKNLRFISIKLVQLNLQKCIT